MDKKLTFTGGEPTINFDDILRTPNATRDGLIAAFRAYGDNYIIQGVTGATSITAGYVMLDGEIIKVDAHTKSSTHFAKITTYESGGDKTFNNALARQTWQKNRATISASSGSLAYASAKRMPDVLVDTITAGTSILAPANLPKATTSLEGIRETATDTEAKALSATDKFITPANLSAVNGGKLTLELTIGDWNMHAGGGGTASAVVNHGLSSSQWKTIRVKNVTIRNDADTLYYDLEFADDTFGISGGVGAKTSSSITLNRITSGLFDQATFSTTSYNRGWIVLEYTP
jgi:hypothetical protein